MTKTDMAAARSWLDRWRSANLALEEQRTLDLAGLDDDDARAITSELFALWRPDEVDIHQSGLVEQQRLFGLLVLRDNAAGR